jgi:hypothetical protein
MTDPAWIIHECRVLFFGKYPDGISGKINEKGGGEEENGKMLEKGRMKTYVRKVLC